MINASMIRNIVIDSTRSIIPNGAKLSTNVGAAFAASAVEKHRMMVIVKKYK